MPEFILNNNPPSRNASHFSARERASHLASLGEFTMGYIEALFFTNGDSGDDVEDRLNTLGTGRLTLGAINRVRDDCFAFYMTRLPAGFEHEGEPFAGSILYALNHYNADLAQAGRDFWYTRQGHGCGFWDGDWDGLPALRDVMDQTARGFGETSFYAAKGWIYSI